MKIEKTNLENCLVISPNVFIDKRGYFFESFNLNTFNQLTKLNVGFVQDNESQSSFGTIRGLHMQIGEMAQAKLVRVVRGKVKDVVIDLRPDSSTYGQKFEIELSEENKKQLFIPRGFLHGFSVLSDYAIFSYKCDNYYDKASEVSVYPLDKTLNINWSLDLNDAIISEKDQQAKSYYTVIKEFENKL